MWLERTKWMLANIGWPIAFTFWYQIMVVLYAANGEISQLALYYFQFLWIIIVCSYFSASFTPPEKCCLVDDGDKKSSLEGFCEQCNYRKPPRWHHCRRCNQCVHRMDHHCPILQLCIHSGNHKYFLLFLLWPLQMAVFTVYNGYYDFWKTIRSAYTGEILSNTEQLKGTGVSNAVMVGFAALYLLKNQLPNLLRNQTLIEESRETTSYDLGSWQENVKSVMGSWRIAWLPISMDSKEVKNERKRK
ncbi:hypothetical protein B9Z55_010128 [Caenorhabditis nigoni]|uniref:Palmitoyltransferase n=1 Tax=Caenorhabditis nigoni TaxID=1611254 RepID=A0A2G5UEP7_9PELO|nr:hypothetical protein B9Z55_010128 [Caenorhabditis nigoni]